MSQGQENTGWIEVIAGPMFSGKTEELIRRVKRMRLARKEVQIFKPKVDDRYHSRRIVSHNMAFLESTPVETAAEIPNSLLEGVDAVAIDEAQFFGLDLLEVCENLADRGIRVLIAGLDQDYRGAPFDPMPQLLAVAEYVTKQLAVCTLCGRPAGKSQRLGQGKGRIEVGAAESYEARCRSCFGFEEMGGVCKSEQIELMLDKQAAKDG